MALIFSREDLAHDQETDSGLRRARHMRKAALLFLLLLVALLLSALKIPLLTQTYPQITCRSQCRAVQETLFNLVPVDPSRVRRASVGKGAVNRAAGVDTGSAPGSVWRRSIPRFNRWTWVSLLALTALTLLTAALGIKPGPDGLEILITGKAICVGLILILLTYRPLPPGEQEVRDWLWNHGVLSSQIFPCW